MAEREAMEEKAVEPDASDGAEEPDKACAPAGRELRPRKNLKPPEMYRDFAPK